MIIVLFGAAGSGKSTIGDILYSQYGYTRAAFSDPLKAMARIAFPLFAQYDLYGPSAARERQEPTYPFSGPCLHCGGERFRAATLSPAHVECRRCGLTYPKALNARIVLQTLGSEWGRRLHRDVWAKACFDGLPAPHAVDAVVTDGRFLNEHTEAKRRGALCVRLTRNGPLPVRVLGRWYTRVRCRLQHDSEAEQWTIPDSAFDFVFDNRNLPLAETPSAVHAMLRHLSTGPDTVK